MEVKPTPINCPFCDSEKVYAEKVQPATIGFAVICSQCKAQGPFVKMDSEAIVKRGATHASVTEPLRDEAIEEWNKAQCRDIGW